VGGVIRVLAKVNHDDLYINIMQIRRSGEKFEVQRESAASSCEISVLLFFYLRLGICRADTYSDPRVCSS
jgi:hypothetical protein